MTSGRNNTETLDVVLGADLILMSMMMLLHGGRARHPGAMALMEECALDAEEREVLNLAAQYHFDHGQPTPLRHIQLKFSGPVQTIRDTVTKLVEKGHIESRTFAQQDVLLTTPTGLVNCTRGSEVAACAEAVVALIKRGTDADGAAFVRYSGADLVWMCNLGPGKAFASAVIDILHLGQGTGSAYWEVPHDVVELRHILDIRGLCARAEQLRREHLKAGKSDRGKAKKRSKKTGTDRSGDTYNIYGPIAAMLTGTHNTANANQGPMQKDVAEPKGIIGRALSKVKSYLGKD